MQEGKELQQVRTGSCWEKGGKQNKQTGRPDTEEAVVDRECDFISHEVGFQAVRLSAGSVVIMVSARVSLDT